MIIHNRNALDASFPQRLACAGLALAPGPGQKCRVMSKLYFSYAAMNAGKSTILLQASWNYQERGMRTMLFTSALYARAEEGRISSRIGINADAHLYASTDDLHSWIMREHKRKKLDCVFVDEAQFLSREQVWQLARVSDRLSIPVLCFGLRTDFQGKLFEGSSELLAIADNLREIRTICHCGRKATMVVRRNADGRAQTSGDQVSIEKSIYVSLCRRHWEEETGRWPVAKPKAVGTKPHTKAAKKASPTPAKAPARKGKTLLKVAAATRQQPSRRTKRLSSRP
jgi:thymidine kinase